MSVHSAFYVILLLWLIQAAVSQEPDKSGCGEICGNVTIPFPFGIKEGCYTSSWFKVNCKDTANGKKPFISRIDVELLGNWLYNGGNQVLVNNPVTYVNCGSKDNGAVNLIDSPFFFPNSFNGFGSVGCGNLAIISGNQSDPLGGCIQPRCGDQGSEAGCYSLNIHDNVTSYTVNLREINPGKEESKRCTSGFVFERRNVDLDFTFPNHINIETTHVRATLEWNPFHCDLEASCQAKGTGTVSQKSCTQKCGDIDIPYPFGVEGGCYLNDWFRIICNETGAFISSINLQLRSVLFSEGSVLVYHPITYFKCHNKDNSGISVNLTGSPFFFSNFRSAFWFSGCGNWASVFRNQADNYPIAGCLQPDCGHIETSSDAGCTVMVPPGLSSFHANMTEIGSSNGSNRSCESAFVIDIEKFDNNFTINLDRYEISNSTHVPTMLVWGIPRSGLCELNEGSNISCSSDGKYCWSNISSTHLCVCSVDFNDDYYVDVCQETGKCGDSSPRYKYCHMLCLNTPGKYCTSPCPDKYRYESTSDRCEPRASKSRAKQRDLAIIIGCSTSIGTAFVLLGTWRMFKVLKRRKNIKLKQKYFKRNGGLLLQQQLRCNEGNVEKIRLFASKELEKATDYYNENRILGQGGQGTVYKGMLTDGSIVAIKKSKMVEEKILDEKKLQQFINEVVILSQINHRNVVNLLGCCLETKVPLLVYEFIPNGTLSQFIHDQNEEFPMTWEMRLRIAAESANALSYLHSAASIPIYHRDIKSSNILLDDKYRAKVSDFGTSISVALEKTHVTTRVQGTFGYMDPEYFRSSQFTEKSDVYSFGVVLAELLTGQKPVSSTQSDETRSLVSFFLHSMKENSLFNLLDPMVMKDGPKEEVIAFAKLAKRSLNLNGKKRPTMKQVAMELERIRASEEANADQSVDEDSGADDVIEPSDIASCSMSRSITNYSVILPLEDCPLASNAES